VFFSPLIKDKFWLETYSVFNRDLSSIFTEAESKGFVKKENIIDIDTFHGGHQYSLSDLLTVQTTGENKCKLSYIYLDYFSWQPTETTVFESCIPELTDIRVIKLDPNSSEVFILFSSLVNNSNFSQPKPPYQFLSIYKILRGSSTIPDGTKAELFLADRLVGQLFISDQDGVVITCDGTNPCQAKVRTWDFDNYPTTLSPPKFEYYTWDSVREKFIPAKP